ncbi:MAG: hypothetical protein AAB522_00255 [Patescibacteria group bacterium]
MSLGNKLKIFGLCCGAFIFNFSFSIAQENNLFLVIFPALPSPNQNYTIEAKSYQFDASRAYFEWFKNGKKVDEGTGVRKKIFEGEGLGSQINIRVTARSPEGKFYEAVAQIGINDIDFIVSPLTYVPPFYRAQALPTSGSIVEVYAIPHLYSQGSRISLPNIIFEWKLDGNAVKEQSGRGKSRFTFSLPKTLMGENEITLKVSSLNGNTAYEETKKIIIKKSEIILYKTSPLLGKSSLAISQLQLKSGENLAVAAEPFFFDLNSFAKSAVSWFVNGSKINTGKEQNPFILELSSPADSKSENNISFKIESEENIFQKGGSEIIIKVQN